MNHTIASDNVFFDEARSIQRCVAYSNLEGNDKELITHCLCVQGIDHNKLGITCQVFQKDFTIYKMVQKDEFYHINWQLRKHFLKGSKIGGSEEGKRIIQIGERLY